MNNYDLNLLRNSKSTYHVISSPDNILVFDYENFAIVKISEHINDILEQIADADTERSEKKAESLESSKAYGELLLLKDKGIIFKDDDFNDEYVKRDTDYLHAEISFPSVHTCNLDCKYCFASAGEKYSNNNQQIEMTADVFQRALDFFVYDFAPKSKYFRIDFVSGGEPLLNYKIIKSVNEYVNDLSSQIEKPIKLWICTNGTCFDEETVGFLNEINQSIGISIDGDRELHDNVRQYKDGTGTYDSIMQGLDLLQKNEGVSKKLKDILVLSVLHGENLDPVKILEHHSQRGIKSVQMKPVRLPQDHYLAINESNIYTLLSNYTSLKNRLVEQINSNDTTWLLMILNDNDYLGKVIISILLRQKKINRCGAGVYKMSVTASGDIYPCDSFVGEKGYVMGNVFDKEINIDKSLFADAHVFNRTPCSGCWNKYLCGGDCYYNSYKSTGSHIKINAVTCILKQHISECAVEIVYAISKRKNIMDYLGNYLRRRRNLKISGGEIKCSK